jgi:hypothetical protein
MAVLTAFLTDISYAIARQPEVYELADLLNERIVVGSIVKSLEDGCVYFRNAFDERDIKPSVDALTRFLSVSAFPLSLWERSYEKLLNNRGLPISCLQAAMIEMNSSDSKVVSRGTRKAILKLEKGAKDESPVPDDETDKSLEIVMRELGMLP